MKPGKNYMNIVKKVYRNTPTVFRFVFWPAENVLRFLKYLRIDQWVLSGKEKTRQQQLNILYAGVTVNKNYVAELAFGNNWQEEYLGKVWLWRVWLRTRQKNNIGLKVVEVPKTLRWALQRQKSFYVPCWVRGEIDIPADISLFVRRNPSLASNVNKIIRNRLSFEVTCGAPIFQEFFDTMYLPYISKIHGNRAVFENFEDLKQRFGKCNILLIEKDGKKIAGMLFQRTKQAVRLLVLGVKDGNLDYVRDGALLASYYFSIQHAQESGCKRVILGGSRAFLEDGILQHKKKWNYRITKYVGTGFLLELVSVTDSTKSFLMNNPFIFDEGANLMGAVFSDDNRPVDEKDLFRLARKYDFVGISNLVFYRFTESGFYRWNNLRLSRIQTLRVPKKLS
jgi:hypothetical protein